MGCGGSKAKKKSDVLDLDENIEVDYKKGSSEVKKMVHTIMALKARLQVATFEKCGVEYTLSAMREQLSKSSGTVQKAKDDYLRLLNVAMERDADELFRALTSNSKADKIVLIDVLTARTKWQMNLITEAYERKHHVPLLKIIKENLRTSLGSITGAGRLLLHLTMDQPERDAQLLQQHLSNFDIITEIVTTRSNRELKKAQDYFLQLNGKSFGEVMAGKLYQNCGKLMKVILECKRSESEAPLDLLIAADTSTRLDMALLKKNADQVIGILANLSYPEFVSVNEAYMKTHKKRTVYQALGAFSGDFYQLLIARCTGKYHYLCSRLKEDRDGITRILGSLTRAECQTLRDCWDVNKDVYGNNVLFEDFLRSEIKKESFLRACLNLVSSDTTNFPLGVDRELRDDEVLVENVVKGVEKEARERYDPEAMRALGEEHAAEMNVEIDMSKPLLPPFKGREQTNAVLSDLEDEVAELKNKIRSEEEEVVHKSELSFAMAAHLRQAEEWTAMYETYASQLTSHLQKQDEAMEASYAESDRRSLLGGAPVFDTLLSITDKIKRPF